MICLQRSSRIFFVVQLFNAGNMHCKPTNCFSAVAVFSCICTILPLFDRSKVLYFLERTIAREQITFVSSNNVVLSRKMFHNHLSTRRRSNKIELQIDRLTGKKHKWGSSNQRRTPNFERMDIFHHLVGRISSSNGNGYSFVLISLLFKPLDVETTTHIIVPMVFAQFRRFGTASLGTNMMELFTIVLRPWYFTYLGVAFRL